MGKNNNNKRPNKPTKNPDPMANTRIMGREGMRLIRNIAQGKFNFYTEGHVFRNKDFVLATMAEVDKRIIEHGIHVNAIRYAYNGSDDPSVLNVLHRDEKALEAYSIVRQTLESIAMTGDTGFLYVLINKLPNYRYNI